MNSQNTSLFSERVAIAAVVAPGARAAGAGNSGWIDSRLYQGLAAVIATGVLGTSATVDGKWQVASDSSGTGAVDAPGTALTQIVKASGDNKVAIHELSIDRLDKTSGKAWVRYVLTVGTATSDATAMVFGVNPRHQPATDYDSTLVVQVTRA